MPECPNPQLAKRKAGGTGPNIVVGAKVGSVKKQVGILFAQMEEYFKSWNDGSMAFHLLIRARRSHASSHRNRMNVFDCVMYNFQCFLPI